MKFMANFIMKRFLIFWMTFVCLVPQIYAQSPLPADEAAAMDPHLKKLADHARKFYNGNPDSLTWYGQLILDYSVEKNNSLGIAEAYNILGVAEQDKENIAASIDFYKKGIEVASRNGLDRTHSALLLNLGNAEESFSNYVSSLEHYLKSAKLKEKLNDSLGMAKCLNNIAQIYSRQGNPKEALVYFQKSLDIKIQFNDTNSIAKTYNNMGVVTNDLNDHEKALQYLTISRDYYIELGRTGDVAMVSGNIALTYDLMGKEDTALIYYLQAMEILEREGDQYDIVVNRINTGSLLLEMNDLERAEKFLLQGLREGKALNSNEDIREACKYLALLYVKKNDYRKAYDYQTQYQVVSDSILNAEKAATLSEMHVRYESEKKDKENNLLTKENELQSILLERNRYLNYGLIILSVLIIAIAVLLIRQARLSARQQATELEQKVLRSQMNPHFIFNSLQSIQGFIFESNALEAGKYLSDFAKLMRLILENSKSEYITLSKETETLHYYLLLQQLRFSGKLDYSFEVDNTIDQDAFMVPPMLLQPAIENAIEHGIRWKTDPGKIIVKIRREGDYFIFVVEDDGVGRGYKPVPSSNGTNHKSLSTIITRERLELINKKSSGKISMSITDLHDPSGTRVEFAIPVKEAV